MYPVLRRIGNISRKQLASHCRDGSENGTSHSSNIAPDSTESHVYPLSNSSFNLPFKRISVATVTEATGKADRYRRETRRKERVHAEDQAQGRLAEGA